MAHIIIPVNIVWNVASRVTGITRATTWNVSTHISTTRIISWNVGFHLNTYISIIWAVNDNPGQGVTTVANCLIYPQPSNVFSRIYVDHLIKGNSKVYWELNRNFHDPGVYSFQLQVGATGIAGADDWINVGSPVVNNFYAIDDTQRLFGKQLNTHYRLSLITGAGTYISQPVDVFGKLNKRDWTLAREITRKEILRMNLYTATAGYLLVAKRAGTVCSSVDPLTNESNNSLCPICYGTGYVGGYYAPLSCVFFDLPPDQRLEVRDLQARGMVDDRAKVARFIGYPLLHSRDVFVSRDSDERYYIGGIKNEADLRGVPIVVAPQVKLAPYSDIIYTFNIPGHGK